MGARETINENAKRVGSVIGDAYMQVTSTNNLLGDWLGGVDIEQITGAIRLEESYAARWSRRSGLLDLTDQYALDKWVADGRAIIKDVEDIVGYTSNVALTTVVADTITKTGNTVAKGPGAIADELAPLVPWWLWLALAVALLAFIYGIYRRARG